MSTMTDEPMGLGWVPAPRRGSAPARPGPARPGGVVAGPPAPHPPGRQRAGGAGGVSARCPRWWWPRWWGRGCRCGSTPTPSFDRRRGGCCGAAWRSAWTYGLRWRASMMFAGLGGRFDHDEWIPRVVRVRAGRYAIGSPCGWWWASSPRTGNAAPTPWPTPSGPAPVGSSLVPGRPGYLNLNLGRQDRLIDVVDPLPIPERVDLDAVPVGVTEDGETWCLAVSGGAHTLVAGCTGSGKGSVMSSLLRGLAPGIRDGLVEVWAVDPKGGMELAPGPGCSRSSPTGPTTWSSCWRRRRGPWHQRAEPAPGRGPGPTPAPWRSRRSWSWSTSWPSSPATSPTPSSPAGHRRCRCCCPRAGAGGDGDRGHAGPPQGRRRVPGPVPGAGGPADGRGRPDRHGARAGAPATGAPPAN